MKHSRRGLALVLVLLVSFVVLGIVLTGLQMASTNVLYVASVHQRNQALSAAEAGVYRVMIELEKDAAYPGPLADTVGGEGAKFAATVEHIDARTCKIRSRGTSGRFSKSLECTVAVAADNFQAVTAEGPITANGPNYVNGIQAMADPLPDDGNLHTNSQARPAISGDYRLSVTGAASAAGTISDVVEQKRKRENAERRDSFRIEVAELLGGTFATGPIPADGVINSNLKLESGVEVRQKIVVANNSTLYIQGDAVFHGGLEGHGAVVVEGNLSARTTTKLDTKEGAGLLLYVENDLTLAHPTVQADATSGDLIGFVDSVGDLFARMPDDTPFFLSQRLPVDAPTGLDFFSWYKQQSESRSETFRLWRDGNQTDLNPGLPADVVEWLDSTIPLNEEIRKWATEP